MSNNETDKQLNELEIQINEKKLAEEKNMSDQEGIKEEESPDPKEEESKEKKEKGIIAKNISKNKKVILYYIGVFIVNIVVRGSNLLALVIPDSPLGLFINGIATDGVLLITFLAPWIFGGREALREEKENTKRVKIERTQMGKDLTWERVKNEGLRISNNLQADLREESGLKPYRYTPPADVGIGSEVKPE